ncbi:hypothetical protein [Okeania sp. KiyG1]|nr:hypothetical protein [Okeania sp. KiyG1]
MALRLAASVIPGAATIAISSIASNFSKTPVILPASVTRDT